MFNGLDVIGFWDVGRSGSHLSILHLAFALLPQSTLVTLHVLGYPTWVDCITKEKMVGSTQNVMDVSALSVS
jgi:hypothetical protein